MNSNTSSINFPNMFDVTSNCVSVVTDSKSIVNRTRLLLLTEPTELYMNPDFGVGLKQYLWQYNNQSILAIIKDRIIAQLKLHEPSVQSEDTQLVSNLLFTGDGQVSQKDINDLEFTVGLKTIYGDSPSIDLARREMYGEGWDKYLGGD